jgi:hypothetical protein
MNYSQSATAASWLRRSRGSFLGYANARSRCLLEGQGHQHMLLTD